MPNTLIYPNFPKRKTKGNDKTKKGDEITNVVQHLTASAIPWFSNIYWNRESRSFSNISVKVNLLSE